MVRDATPLDILTLAQMGLAYREEAAGLSDLPPDLEHAMHCALCTLSDPGGILLVYEHDGEIQGFLWAVVGQLSAWSPQLIAHDYLLYLAPEHRKGWAGVRLIRSYYQRAKALGAHSVILTHASQIGTERADKLYRLCGFHPMGMQYRRT